jgi:hypothetical protein
MNIYILFIFAVAKYNSCFLLFSAEKAGLDKKRRRKEGGRERSGGINLLFTEPFNYFTITLNKYRHGQATNFWLSEGSVQPKEEQMRAAIVTSTLFRCDFMFLSHFYLFSVLLWF